MVALALVLSCSLQAAPVSARVPVSASLLGQTDSSVAVVRTDKSLNPFVVALELVVATGAAYLGVVVGVALNFPLGGISAPPDQNDLLLVGGLPVLAAAAGGWAVGLLDLKQRSFAGSALSAVLGSLVGEVVGLGVGYLGGRAASPGDLGSTLSIAVFIAPVFAALGSVVAMEWLKPGATAEVSGLFLPVRTHDGAFALVPGLAGRF